MSSVKHVTEKSFSEEVLQSSVPVLVDFYAEWCGPCRMLAPTLEKLSAEFEGQAKIVKVNVDQEPNLADRFQVSSIPTLMAWSGGQLAGRSEGMAGEASLRNALNQLVQANGSSPRQAG